MCRVLIFGGTTEGRMLAENLTTRGISCLVCVATDYGEALMPDGINVHSGRLNIGDMKELISENKPQILVDATHPYADKVRENLQKACADTGLQYLRIIRQISDYDGCKAFDDMESLIGWLNKTPGTVFAAMGVKSAQAFTKLDDFENRVYFRILPFMDSLKTCLELGYPPSKIICMQGPFSKELNKAMFKETGAKILVTKESGKSGGFMEKLEAAEELGMKTAVLRRPPDEAGMCLEDAVNYIGEKYSQ